MRWVLSARRVRSSLRLALFSQCSADRCSATNEPASSRLLATDIRQDARPRPTHDVRSVTRSTPELARCIAAHIEHCIIAVSISGPVE